MLITPRRRILLDSDTGAAAAPHPARLSTRAKRPDASLEALPGECGRLVTRASIDGHQVLSIRSSHSFYIGRSPDCDFTIAHPAVSSKHCRLYALTVDTGEVLVCLEDTSTNGTLYNQRRVSRATTILSDGDTIEIGNYVFRYEHLAAIPPLMLSAGPEGAAERPCPVGDFLVLPRTLGSGAFSRVHLAFSTKSLRQFACKRMRRRRMQRDDLAGVKREVEMLMSASHPNINRVEAVEVDEHNVFLELVPGGDLFSYLIKHGRIDAPEVKWIMYQILLGLRHLHDDINIAHRDIKLENIVLACAGPFPRVQLTDFGQARLADENFRSLQGTLQYMAPEQLLATSRDTGYSGKPADIWSSGIVFAYLLTGGHPFEPWEESTVGADARGGALASTAEMALLGETACTEIKHSPKDGPICRAVIRGALTLPAMKFGQEDRLVRKLLCGMLAHQPERRYTAASALSSDWMLSSKAALLELYRRTVA